MTEAGCTQTQLSGQPVKEIARFLTISDDLGEGPKPKRFASCVVVSPSSASACPSQRVEPVTSRLSTELKLENNSNYGSEPESEDSDEEDQGSVGVPTPFEKYVIIEPKQTLTSSPLCGNADITDMSNPPLDFQWKSFPTETPLESRRETFSQLSGPTASYVCPEDAFVSIWDQSLVDHIVLETNNFARQLELRIMEENGPGEWTDVTDDELYVYIALTLAMGVVVKASIQEYWSVDNDIFATPGFCSYMSLNRYQSISKCLSFYNNERTSGPNFDESEVKLCKILPIVNHLNDRFQRIYNMGQNIALDESIWHWKGGTSWNQFISREVKGVKCYELTEPQTGYLWRFMVHDHHVDSIVDDNPATAFTPALILGMVRGLEHKGYTVWLDRFYNSPVLARKLKSLGFDCAGILHPDQQHVPIEIAELAKTGMEHGSIVGSTSGDVDIMAWKSKELVATISTYHGNAVSSDDGKPTVIRDFNGMMGLVHKKYKLLSMYPDTQSGVWYKKLFRRFLNVSVLNSHVVYNNSDRKMSHRNFRMAVIRGLLVKYSPAVVKAVHFAKDHYPVRNKGNSSRDVGKTCSICCKPTAYYCAGCYKPACSIICFPKIHK